MRINVQSYNHLSEGELFLQGIAVMVERNLSRFSGRITRVDVLLIEENKNPEHHGCVIEAQVTGMESVAVRSHAGTLTRAVTVGTEKMEQVIEHALEPKADDEFESEVQ